MSIKNDKAKHWTGLTQKKGRDESGKFLIEGHTLILEAINFGVVVEEIIVNEGAELREQTRTSLAMVKDAIASRDDLSVKWFEVSDTVFSKLTETVTPQGIAAVVRQPLMALDELELQTEGMYVLMDGVQDPGNLGTLIRTADAAGAKGIVLGEGTVDPFNPKVVRSTMGSLFHLPIIKAPLSEVIPRWRKAGMDIVGTRLEDSKPHFDHRFKQLTGIVVGNEANGVSTETAAQIDEWVKIPMLGAAESLNAAIATAVVMYEAVRQWRQ